MSDIRLDRIHNKYVLIAPERLRRPDFLSNEKAAIRSSARCPFCEGNESLTPPEIMAVRDNEPNAQGWLTRVVPNLYKAVQIELEDRSKREGMFESIPGVGAHEVLIDTPNHECGIECLDTTSIEHWLRTLLRRTADLKNDRRLIHLNIFKNKGHSAGATQEHPHTQILALPVMPRSELMFLERNMTYYSRHGRGIVQDMLENEIYVKERIIKSTGNFIALCPFASGFPFEVMIAPKVNITSLVECHREDISDLSSLLHDVFKKMKRQLGDFDYNLYISMAPLNNNFENDKYMSHLHDNFRFVIRIIPRIYTLGGFEMGTGMNINPVSPEECAKMLNSGENI